MQKCAIERDAELQHEWMVKFANYIAEQLVFLDESMANEQMMDRKYGWAPVSQCPVDYAPFKWSERWSILPVYTAEDGFLV